MRELESALGLHKLDLSAGGITAKSEDVLDATLLGFIEHIGELSLRGTDASEMRHRGELELALDAVDDAERFVARAAAGSISHRAIIRTELHQFRHGFLKQGPLALRRFGRKELERQSRTALGLAARMNVADEMHFMELA